MNKEQQDLSWACLPKEMRDEIKAVFNKADNFDMFVIWSLCSKLFGLHNLISDTEPEEMLMVERKRVQELYDGLLNEKKAVSISTSYGGTVTARLQMLRSLFGNKCLPDKEPSVQDEPKFKLLDKVRIIKDCVNKGRICTIYELEWCEGIQSYVYRFKKDEVLGTWAEEYLEPYTEPETKSMQLSDVKEKIDNYFDSHTEEEVLETLERYGAIETKDNMKEK